LGLKNPKCYLGELSGIQWIPVTGRPTKYSDKLPGVSEKKDGILLDPPKIQMVFYSAMRRKFLADGESISRSLEISKNFDFWP